MSNSEFKPYFWTGKGKCHRTKQLETQHLYTIPTHVRAMCGTSTYGTSTTDIPPSLRDMCTRCFPMIPEENDLRDVVLKRATGD